jgi:integrase
MEGQRNIGTPKEFQAENLLESFFAETKLQESAKMALKTAVLSFYKHNRRELASNTASNITHPEYKQRCPDMHDILDLEDAMQNQRDKAILWFLASTAFRIGTLVELTWNDLEPTQDSEVPYQLVIESSRLKGKGKGRYRGLKQVAFLHSLAVDKLENYKKEIHRRGYRVNGDSPIFIAYRKNKVVAPLGTQAVEAKFATASLVAWHDLETKRFSPHGFRDFMKSKLESAGLNSNIIAPMLAHKPRGIDFHYSKHEVDELLQKYKKALSYLLPQTVEKVKAEQQKEVQKLQNKIDDLELKLATNTANLIKTLHNYLDKAGIEHDFEDEAIVDE